MTKVLGPRLTAALVVAMALVLAALPATPGQADRGTAVPYLALGDSLPYGWDVITQRPDVDPSAHVGYPETLAARSPLVVTNAACPGETSTSFIDGSFGNGCGFVKSVLGPGLKVDLEGRSQLEFAKDFLSENPDTGLVSLQLGANDLFICQDGPGECDVADVLQTTATRIAYSLGQLRAAPPVGPGYDGQVVLVGYYALDYRDPDQRLVSTLSRDALMAIAGSGLYGDVVVADGYAAFEQASRRSGGSPFEADLLLPPGPGSDLEYDVHTTPRGDKVMVRAVRQAIDLGSIVSQARSGR